MEHPLRIWPILKDSLKSVFCHFGSWMKMALVPLIIMVITFLVAFVIELCIIVKVAPEDVTLLPGMGVFALGMAKAYLLFARNAYQYVTNQETGAKWVIFRFERYTARLFAFFLIITLISMILFGAGGETIALAFEKSLLLNMGWFASFFGFFSFFAFVYITILLVLAVPFARYGMGKSVRQSLALLHEHRMKVIGLILAVSSSNLLLMLAGWGFLIPVGFLHESENLAVTLIGALGADILIAVVFCLLLNAIGLTALIKTYQTITQK